jgi:hypothetical protein
MERGDPRWPATLGAAIGFSMSLLLTATFVLAGRPVAAALAALAVAVAWIAWACRPLGGLVTGLCGWLMLNGFVEHTTGELGWDGRPDAERLALLLGVAVVASALRLGVLSATRRATRGGGRSA